MHPEPFVPGPSELDLIRSSGARVHVAVVEGRPCMVLATLLETFGVSSPRLCFNVRLLQFFSACGVSGDLSSEEAALIHILQISTHLAPERDLVSPPLGKLLGSSRCLAWARSLDKCGRPARMNGTPRQPPKRRRSFPAIARSSGSATPSVTPTHGKHHGD